MDGQAGERPRSRIAGVAGALALAALAPACAGDEGRPPVARIELVPDQIGENDGFQTVVVLDGTASADPVDHPEGARLGYAWQILDDEVRFEPGSHTDDDAPEIRLRGDRPATIVLTVTDEDGLTASTTTRLRLTASR
jgi:hypothetical protein